MSEQVKLCKRCMLDDMIKNSKAELQKYISSMSDDIKVENDEYEKRLTLCDKCDKLVNGVCGLCGCFVMARAAKKIMSCPASPPKWLKTE